MDIRTQRKMMAILRVLHEAGKPLGGTRIAEALQEQGFDLSQRTVRHYLAQTDSDGLTRNRGKRGRELTSKGEKELESALAVDKIGFVAARVDALAYQMSFTLSKCKGKVILNVSTIPTDSVPRAVGEMMQVFHAGLSVGQFAAIGLPGQKIGEFRVPDGHVAVGTVCSVTVNGILLSEGIATTSRFGGLLEMENGRPLRFTQIIHYDGSTLDPLEIFIKGHMTRVREASSGGKGLIGASFREVPAPALPEVQKLEKKLQRMGLGSILMFGKPNQPLLDIPVGHGRVGMLVVGGLNPLAAVEEAGIPTHNAAMSILHDFEHLSPCADLLKLSFEPEYRRKG